MEERSVVETFVTGTFPDFDNYLFIGLGIEMFECGGSRTFDEAPSISIFGLRGTDRNGRVAVYGGHLLGLNFPVCERVLDDAERVDPDVAEAEVVCYLKSFLECLRKGCEWDVILVGRKGGQSGSDYLGCAPTMAECCVGSELIRAFMEERRECLCKLLVGLTEHGNRIYLFFVVIDVYHSMWQYGGLYLATGMILNTVFDPSFAAVICLCRIRAYRRKLPNRKRITSGRCSCNISVKVSHGTSQLLMKNKSQMGTACVSQLGRKQYHIPPSSSWYISKNLIVLTASTLKLDSER